MVFGSSPVKPLEKHINVAFRCAKQLRGFFAAAIAESGAPDDIAWLLNYLFETVLDGRNAYVCDGVKRALGREPTEFADYARRIAARGTWNAPDEEVAA